MGNFTQEELAKRMGKAQSTIANKMRLLSLTNEVQVALMNNLISERHARCLLQIKDEDKQKEVLNKIISERMNVRDTDNYIKNMLGIQNNTPAPELETHGVELPKELVTPVAEPIQPAPTPEISNINIDNTIENPNVYTQTDNKDFVNIGSLNEDNSVKNALNVTDKTSTIFNDSTSSIEETPKINIPKQEKPIDNMSKVKLATAIRLAKDTVEDIKTAGYKVTMEEKDLDDNYEIIIKVEK